MKEGQKYIPFRSEDASKLAREGEELIQKGFVKTEGFEKSVAFFMTLAEEIYKAAQMHKRFRMELIYDAESLNTNYCFFLPKSTGSLSDSDLGCQEFPDPDPHKERTGRIEDHFQKQNH